MSEIYRLNQQSSLFGTEYKVKKGENAWVIAQRNGLSLEALQELNPDLNLNKIKAGQNIILKTAKQQQVAGKNGASLFTNNVPKSTKKTGQPAPASLFSPNDTKSSGRVTSFNITGKSAPQTKQVKTTGKTTASNNILTLEKFKQNMTPEAKLLKPFLEKNEGNVANVYIAPDGNATIGHGHLLINKPQFLIDIEKKQLSPKEKNKLIQTALLKEENKTALKQALQQELQEAIKKTGIKNVPSTINKNLKLTKEQTELLLCSDIQKAQEVMTKTFGSDVLSKRTTNQKLVALDLYFNVGRNLSSKAPEFVKQFKAGNMDKAQAELDIFKTNGKVALGLIKRNYQRMLLLNNNRLSPLAKKRLLTAYNKYLEQHNKELAQNFSEAEKVFKRA